MIGSCGSITTRKLIGLLKAFGTPRRVRVMLSESERERIRRAYYLQKKSIRRIAQEEGYSRETVERAISDIPSKVYHLSQPRPAPRLGPFHARIETLVAQNKHLPRKQRYT